MASSSEKPFTALLRSTTARVGPTSSRRPRRSFERFGGMIVLYRGISILPDFTPAAAKNEIDLPGCLEEPRA